MCVNRQPNTTLERESLLETVLLRSVRRPRTFEALRIGTHIGPVIRRFARRVYGGSDNHRRVPYVSKSVQYTPDLQPFLRAIR